MKLSQTGKSTSKPEVTNISQHGFWLFIDGKEYYLPFEKYPWFLNAVIKDIINGNRSRLQEGRKVERQ